MYFNISRIKRNKKHKQYYRILHHCRKHSWQKLNNLLAIVHPVFPGFFLLHIITTKQSTLSGTAQFTLLLVPLLTATLPVAVLSWPVWHQCWLSSLPLSGVRLGEDCHTAGDSIIRLTPLPAAMRDVLAHYVTISPRTVRPWSVLAGCRPSWLTYRTTNVTNSCRSGSFQGPVVIIADDGLLTKCNRLWQTCHGGKLVVDACSVPTYLTTQTPEATAVAYPSSHTKVGQNLMQWTIVGPDHSLH